MESVRPSTQTRRTASDGPQSVASVRCHSGDVRLARRDRAERAELAEQHGWSLEIIDLRS